MKKVIFLDIDGVLNVISQGFDEFGSIFHQHFVDNLKTIIDKTNAKIVISSTWRYMGLKKIQKMWEFRDLPGEVIDITPYTASEKVINLYAETHSGTERGYEIQEWIDNNKPDKYVIIDDDDDMLNIQLKYFVKTSGNSNHDDCIDIGYGLTKICTNKIIEILNN